MKDEGDVCQREARYEVLDMGEKEKDHIKGGRGIFEALGQKRAIELRLHQHRALDPEFSKIAFMHTRGETWGGGGRDCYRSIAR